MSDLSNPIFPDEAKARKWLELGFGRMARSARSAACIAQATLMKGKTTRPGLYQCNACREPFTVTVGTLYERARFRCTSGWPRRIS